jgi:hypothetical protein
MGDANRFIGFVVIVVLYLTIGIMAAAGCVAIGQRFLRHKLEQVFYGVFLVMIAAFYLAFTAYFQIDTAWRRESVAVLAFAVMGVVGARVPALLIVGYPLHGLWDLLHELQQVGAISAFPPGEVTPLPLAYGVFCAAFDLYIAVYAYLRRAEWSAAWRGRA